METTVDLDEDVASLLREEAERTGQPLKQVLNETLRLFLRRSGSAARVPYHTRPHDFGATPGLDLDHLSEIADDLETVAILRRLRADS